MFRPSSEDIDRRRGSIMRDEVKFLHGIGGLNKGDILIALMGPSGSGKSSFLSTVAMKDIGIVHRLESAKSEVKVVRVPMPEKTTGASIVLAETPGFDATDISDLDVLQLIYNWLRDIGRHGIGLQGILYFHEITVNRMTGAPLKNLELLKKICGSKSLSQVAIVTTKWDTLAENVEQIGRDRENELKKHHWKDIVRHDSLPNKFEGTYNSAWSILSYLLHHPRFEEANRGRLQLQTEIEQGKTLRETGAGSKLYAQINEEERQRREHIKKLSKDIAYHNKTNPEARQHLQEEYEKLQGESGLARTKMESLRFTYTERAAKSLARVIGQLARAGLSSPVLPLIDESPRPEGTTLSPSGVTDPSTSESETHAECWVLLSELAQDKDKRDLISKLDGDEAQRVVDFLSEVLELDNVPSFEEARTTLLHLLSRLAKSAQVYPKSFELSGVDWKLNNTPEHQGGFGAIYKRNFRGRAVCIKAVNDRQNGKTTALRAQVKELVLWARLSHPNILPFYGVYFSNEKLPRICIVSPWMENGDLDKYLQDHPETPRIPLILDTISGLAYMHEKSIVHADLKAKNVLVSKSGRAMLADFGISHVSLAMAPTTQGAGAGTANWMAPEQIAPEQTSTDALIAPTQECDIWAFGCTCYEILMRKVPFQRFRIHGQVVAALMKGETPVDQSDTADATKLKGDYKKIWDWMMLCWDRDPKKRPTSAQVKSWIAGLRFPDSRESVDSDIRLVMEELRRARAHTIMVDYARVYATFLRIKNTPSHH